MGIHSKLCQKVEYQSLVIQFLIILLESEDVYIMQEHRAAGKYIVIKEKRC